MKIKLAFLVLFSLTINVIVDAKPLTIINATTSPMKVQIFAKSYDEPINTIVNPGGKQEYEMQDLIFDRMVWEAYGKKESADAFLLKKYVINISEKMPTMDQGGTIVFSLGGQYMYDDKSGKRNAVRFGIGEKFNNGIEKGQSNEE